jgi:hypothetical protein
MATIKLERWTGTYTIEVPDCGETLGDVIDDLIVPVLLAAGFKPESVDRYIGGKGGYEE